MRFAALGVLLCCTMPLCSTLAQVYRFEAETGQLFGVQVASSVPGYSGTGYVTGFNSSTGADYFQLQANIPPGLYEMWVGYRSQYGQKGYDYRVNNEYGSGMFDQSTVFTRDRAGLFSIPAGTSTLGIYQSWGYYDVDYLEFRPYTPPALLPVSSDLVDSQADYHTRVLMNYLASQYGQKTLSGQHHQQSENLAFPVTSYLSKSGGIVPAIRSSDFIEYSPSRLAYGATPDNETEQAIAWARQTGGAVSMMWHWNAPANLINQTGKEWWRGFYSYATTFDLPGALANPSGSDYQLLLRDIDAIAVELQKFEDAGVPVIWHPLHEAQGGWFWWGDHGPDSFKSLWNLMYDRLTNYHGLHNLIWEYTIATSGTEAFNMDWYPGDDKVDMVGLDIYTDASSSMSGEWIEALNLFNGNKMIALSETGTVPDPTLMEQWGIAWSYFSPWKGSFVDDMDPVKLQATLNDEDIVILNELPVMPWKNQGVFLSADFNFDGTVDLVDLGTWQAAYGVSSAGDADGDGDSDGADFLIWQRQVNAVNTLSSLPLQVPEPGNLLLGAAMILITARNNSRVGRKQWAITDSPFRKGG